MFKNQHYRASNRLFEPAKPGQNNIFVARPPCLKKNFFLYYIYRQKSVFFNSLFRDFNFTFYGFKIKNPLPAKSYRERTSINPPQKGSITDRFFPLSSLINFLANISSNNRSSLITSASNQKPEK